MEASTPGAKPLVASLVRWLFDGSWPTTEAPDAAVTVQGAQRVYTLRERLAVGDVADVFLAAGTVDPPAGGTPAVPEYLVKASRLAAGDDLLDNERQVLARLHTAAGDTTYRRYLPRLLESFAALGGHKQRINVFTYEPGFYTLEQVHEQHPALDGRHLGWICNRLLTVLGFVHRQDIRHGAVLPCHVLLHPADHGLQLVGWGHSVERGRRLTTISTRYRAWYPPEVLNREPALPATDLFLAARCLVYLAGGDAISGRMPDAVPPSLRRFLGSCLLEGPRMRPDDAWALQEEFGALLCQLYGPPKFHHLSLT